MKVSFLNQQIYQNPVQNNQKTKAVNLSANNASYSCNASNMISPMMRPFLGKVAFGAGRIFAFEEGNTDRMIVGGKGAGLAEMTAMGLPVPAGFTITTDVCHEYTRTRKLPDGLMGEVMTSLKEVEKKMGKDFGDTNDPLLVSVRSGAPKSMPGMMDTILNVGLNDRTVIGLTDKTGNERFAQDSYRRLIQMFGSTVKEIDKNKFEHSLDAVKEEYGVKNDSDLNAEGMKKVVKEFKKIYKEETGEDFPQDVKTQLQMCIETVFDSWNSPRAITYRKVEKIPANYGTAVNVQSMVFGNMGDDSATGVAFTRNPKTGENILSGDYVTNGQGEDVVAGIRQTKPVENLGDEMPEVHKQYLEIKDLLERSTKDMQDTEFTVEKNRLWLLQTRTGKRTAQAAVKVAVDQHNEGLITKEEAIMRINPKDLLQLLLPVFDPKAKKTAEASGDLLAKGTPCAGCATGTIVFDPDRAEALAKEGKQVILVRKETSPDDIHGMAASKGILTATGGRTSHAAIVALQWGIPAVVGCDAIKINDAARTMKVGDRTFKEGDTISIDGNVGEVFAGRITTIDAKPTEEFKTLLGWAREIKKLGVETNADRGIDAQKALEWGAEGIGLCRTEHMFLEQDRLPLVQDMILADDAEARKAPLAKLAEMQRGDFLEIFKVMKDKPVTVRLLDPPLHEFLPKKSQVAEDDSIPATEKARILQRIDDLHEANPMIGTRGCRLGITRPEITEMQAKAVIEAACDAKEQGISVHPEIMVPNVAFANEFAHQKNIIDTVAQEVMERRNVKVDYKVGTMIETPRAALTEDEIVRAGAQFGSVGSNDLTQGTLLMSRDDTAKLLNDYQEKGIIQNNPFETLDPAVAELIGTAVQRAKSVNPDTKIGICGEHGGDPESVVSCHKNNLDYVSCSPLRIPVAIVAAAQAEIKDPKKAK